MSTVKRIICLANSRKLSGRCVAGIEIATQSPAKWIRPVSDREHGEVSAYERRYQNGEDPQVLDIMDIPLKTPIPKTYQQENWLLDPGNYWTKVDQAKWNELSELPQPSEPIWTNGYSTYDGLNDKVPLALANELDSSLRLVHADALTLSVFNYGEAFGNAKRRVQGKFRHNKFEYHLWVTDPRYEQAYRPKPDGEYKLGECYLTISLGEPYNDACYKLIAAIIERGKGSLP